MKKLVVLFASSICIVVTQSFSSSSVELSEDEPISVVSEESALLSISYSFFKTFTLTNNTEDKIYIDSIDLEGNGIISNFHTFIMPGDSREYTILGESQALVGTSMVIKAYSEQKNIEIISILPQFIEDTVILPSETTGDSNPPNNGAQTIEKVGESTSSESSKDSNDSTIENPPTSPVEIPEENNANPEPTQNGNNLNNLDTQETQEASTVQETNNNPAPDNTSVESSPAESATTTTDS